MLKTLLRIVLGTAMVSAACPASAADKIEAKERRARIECAAGNHVDGVRLLAELWVSTGLTSHLFNQARCYEMSGQDQLAATHFREFLRKATDLPSKEVDEINHRIEELQRQANSRGTAAPVAPAPAPTAAPQAAPVPAAPVPDRSAELVSSPQPAPVNDSPVYTRWWFWTGVGAVVVGGVVTGILISHPGTKSPACDPGVLCVR